MSDATQSTEEMSILVNFPDRPGVQKVSLFTVSEEKLAQKSDAALDRAMGLIAGMAHRAGELRDKLPVEFTQAEIEFGVTMDYEVGAMLAKVGAEAAINVTLTWEREKKAAR